MNGFDLMKKLGSGIVPAGVTGTPATLGRAGEGSVFDTLLKGMSTDSFDASQAVTVSNEAASAGVKLTEEQLGRFAKAADKAERTGAKSALVELDGQFYTLDVASRKITGIADLAEGTAIGSLDTIIKAAPNPAATGNVTSQDANWLLKRLKLAQ